ncbi:MAG: S-adenosylmethionine synthase [Ignavibacteriaceae bacterium]|nr:MAG: S-adenosylmethionine synthase [Ignavibacteriaceae bacterium]
MSKEFFFTSESVSEGHPDKIADQISDAVLDDCLRHDPDSRVACETLVGKNLVVLTGEITSSHKPDYEKIVRDTLNKIGYRNDFPGINPETCTILINIVKQVAEISQGVTQKDDKLGAGDQGIMFGYATNETDEYLPVTLALSHRILKELARIRHAGEVDWLRPDAKSQVTVKYVDSKPVAIDTIVVSTQHSEKIAQAEIEEFLREHVIENGEIIPLELLKDGYKFHVNPTGAFTEGGPVADAGLTGRKIIVDTYGGAAPHGGGAFSGKDYTKVDRSAAYIARYAAKNVVAAGLADKCTIQLSYAIGVTEPISILVDTHGTGKVDESRIEAAVKKVFDFTPRGIIETLQLKRPIYSKTAAYGHFGRNDAGFTWERTDKVEELKNLVK